MEITCYGVRGSFPVTDSPSYGGHTSSLRVVSADGGIVFVDAGTGLQQSCADLAPEGKCSLFLTHTHWDHIIGLPFFPLLFLEGWHIDIYEPAQTVNTLTLLLDGVHFPVHYRDLPASVRTFTYTPGDVLELEGMRATTLPLPHPGGNAGLRLEADGVCAAFSGDCEINGHEHLAGELLRNAAVALVDAQYSDAVYPTRTGWGHSTHEVWLPLAKDAHVPLLLLGHHNHEDSDDTLDKTDRRIRDMASRMGLQARLLREGYRWRSEDAHRG